MDLEQFNLAAWVQNYTYDSLGRLTNTISPAGPFQYTYSRGYTDAFRDNDNTPDNVTAGGQVESLRYPSGAYITNDFDGIARLSQTALVAMHLTNTHGYAYNNVHQRTRHVRNGSEYVDYLYDDIHQ